MEWLGHGTELLAQADRLRCCNAQGHDSLLDVHAQQAGAGSGRTQHACRTRNMPAPVVVIGVDHIAGAARHINADDQSIDKLTAAGTGKLSQGKQRGAHRPGGMNDGLQVRIVEIEGMRGRSEEHTSELQSLMRTSYAVFCLKKKKIEYKKKYEYM